MRDLHKNPLFYYIGIPLLLALWPLLIWAFYLPHAEKSWDSQKKQYEKAQKIITEILTLDPERLDLAGSKAGSADFDYAIVVEKIASMYHIASANYKLSSGIILTTGGQKSQSANLTLKRIDLSRFANFLSTIQLRWACLQCTQIKLTKKKGLPDAWDVDLALKYYY
jgi:hypothetical protein